MAHELSHIRHYDAMSGGFWTASVVAVNTGLILQQSIISLIASLAYSLNIPAIVVRLLMLPLYAVQYATKLATEISRAFFKWFDRYIGRAMEYRSDRDATLAVGKNAGVSTLMRLNRGIEPALNPLFANHPTTRKRIVNIRRTKVKNTFATS